MLLVHGRISIIDIVKRLLLDRIILFKTDCYNIYLIYILEYVLIILKNEYSGKDENKILDLCYDIDLKYNILIDAHLISEQELDTSRGKQPVFVNALQSGIYA